MEKLYGTLKDYLRGKIHNRDDADDLTQDVWVKVIAKSNIEEVQNLQAWIFSVARKCGL